MRSSDSLAAIVDRTSSGATAITPSARRRIARRVLRRIKVSPDQWRAVQAINTHPLVCIQANRRAGKTTTIFRLILARLISRDNYIVRVVTHRLGAPSRTWLDSGHGSFVDLISRLGLQNEVRYDRTAGSIRSVRFSWGSELVIHDCGHTNAIDSHRGVTADFWWADEAQHLPLLALVLTSLVLPTRVDRQCSIVLSGTPGRDSDSSFFYYSRGERGWYSERFFCWQNPLFGPTFEVRWATLIESVVAPAQDLYKLSDDDVERLRSLTEDELGALAVGEADEGLQTWAGKLDPHFQREILGRWVIGGGDYVFDWLTAEDLYLGSSESSPYPHGDLPVVADTIAARVAALPKKRTGQFASWYCVVGLDPGWNPSETAWVVLAWSPEHYGDQFVIWSEKCKELPMSQIFDRTIEIINDLRYVGVTVVGVRADFNGTLKNVEADWSTGLASRFPASIYLTEADKSDKVPQIRAANVDLCRGQIHTFAGDPIDIEGRNLRFIPFDPERPQPAKIDKFREITLPDGRTLRPGDHCLDAWRYARADCPYATKREEIAKTEPYTGERFVEWIEEQNAKADGFR